MNASAIAQPDAPAKPRTFLITIPGVARGKQRPRVVRRGKFVSTYTPKETMNAEAWIRHCCIEQVGQPCLDGALSLTMEVITEIPQSWSRKKQEAAMGGVIFPTGAPDADNLAKTCGDALDGVMWKRDSQIVSLSVTKRYGRAPCTTLRVTTL